MLKVKTVLFLLLTVVSLDALCQSFEGKIIYKTSYKSKQAGTSDEQLAILLGTTQEYIIKGGNYYSKMNGSFFQWQLYKNDENKYYLKLGNSDKVFWQNAEENKDKAIFKEYNKGVTEILGHKCDELIFESQSGIHKYYFSKDLPIDSKLFTNHNFGNWYEYLSRANALPLKEIVDSKDFFMESTATSVIEEKVDSSTFSLSPNTELAPYPF